MDPISFSRKPYNVSYRDFHTGEMIHQRRLAPVKVHDMLPTDIVELSEGHGDDWEAGERSAIKHISYRQPNVLQLQKSSGDTTFVEYTDVNLIERVASRGKARIDDAKLNRYLTWP